VSEQAYEYDEQQYEIDVVIRDTIRIWAGSRAEAQDKAVRMGYRESTGAREVPGG
jgi:hypothetical protein